MPSQHVLNRIKTDWEKVAKEPLEVENIKGTLYAYGSELAVLRLFYYYNRMDRNSKTRMGYSENLKTWYFSLELMYSHGEEN